MARGQPLRPRGFKAAGSMAREYPCRCRFFHSRQTERKAPRASPPIGVSAFAISAACWDRPRSLKIPVWHKSGVIALSAGRGGANTGREEGHRRSLTSYNHDDVLRRQHFLTVPAQFVGPARTGLAGGDHCNKDQLFAVFAALTLHRIAAMR